MPRAKKAATKKPAASKKAAPKKVEPKKVEPKKAAPEKVEAKHRAVKLFANTGIFELRFTDDKTFEAAMAIIKSTPTTSGGARNVPLRTIFSTGQKCSFHVVTKYEVSEL